MRKFFLLGIILAATLASCVKADDFRILEVEEMHLESFSTPVVTLRIQNNSRKKVEILRGKFTIKTSAGKVGEVMLTDKVVIPKRAVTSITLPLKMKISNPLAAAPLLSGGNINVDKLLITGDVDVRAGAARMNYRVEDSPLSRFMSIFGSGTN